MQTHCPDRQSIVFECDMCPATETLSDTISPVNCLNTIKARGWTSKKVPGYAWELYCPGCSKDPKRRPVAKGEKNA